ncbi:MAG: hypothetical protein ACT4NU_02230 [Chromatiales bacterium]
MLKEFERVKKWQASPEKMDERINRLRTAEECEIFSKNVTERGFPELAARAQRRAVELQAATHDAHSEAERDALKAVYAYEQILSKAKLKKTRATGTWQLVRRLGVIGAIQSLVNRNAGEAHFTTLKETGMQDLAFESIVLKHPEAYIPETVERCAARLGEWTQA